MAPSTLLAVPGGGLAISSSAAAGLALESSLGSACAYAARGSATTGPVAQCSLPPSAFQEHACKTACLSHVRRLPSRGQPSSLLSVAFKLTSEQCHCGQASARCAM